METLTIVILGIIVVPVVVCWAIYNGLVRKKNDCEQAFGNIDVYLKKRYDLIPNLVKIAGKYMKHEKEVFTKITELRAQAMSGNASQDDSVKINSEISSLLGGIKVAMENYPQLKADTQMTKLQGSMNEIEEQISAARRTLNACVTILNNAVEMFPSNIFAGMFGFKKRELFAAEEIARENVSVDFGD